MTIRAYVPALPVDGGEVELGGDEHHYLFRVRRLTVDDAVVLVDADGREADAVVLAIVADRARLRAAASRLPAPPRPRIVVIQALIKGERMEWCIEKLAEVGADEIVLYAADRSVVRLDAARGEARRERLAALARAAARQSQRSVVPIVTGPMTLAAAIAGLPEGARLVCHPGAGEAGGLASVARADAVAILVGPEGGFSPQELDRAVATGFAPIALGDGVLRAETAGVVAVGALRLQAFAFDERRTV